MKKYKERKKQGVNREETTNKKPNTRSEAEKIAELHAYKASKQRKYRAKMSARMQTTAGAAIFRKKWQGKKNKRGL